MSKNLDASAAKYQQTTDSRNNHRDKMSAEICALETQLGTIPPRSEYRLKISENLIKESDQPPSVDMHQDDRDKPLIVACEYLSWRQQPSIRFRLCYELSIHDGFQGESSPSSMPRRLQSKPFRSEIKQLIECKSKARIRTHVLLSRFVDPRRKGFNDQASFHLMADCCFVGELLHEACSSNS